MSTQGGQADEWSTGEQSYILRLAATASFETAAALSCLWRRKTRHQADRKRLEVGRIYERWRKAMVKMYTETVFERAYRQGVTRTRSRCFAGG